MFSERFGDAPPELNAQWKAKLALEAAGHAILDLTQSNPTTAGLAYPDSIPALLGREGILQYAPTPNGHPEARQAISNYYKSRKRIVPAEDLILTASTSEAYTFLFKLLCNPGDEVLIPSPGYPLFDTLADLENVKLMRYRLTKDNQNFQWRTDFKFLRGQISTRTKAIVLVNPNNPTGHICTADELFAYVDLAKEFDLALIVDEVFSDFLFGPTAFVPLISEGPHVFTLNGFSKLLGLPQLKLGWIHLSGSRRLVEQALGHLEEIADAFLSVNTPVQLAAADLLSLVGPIQSTLMHRLRANLKMADSMLQSSQCVKASPPQAGWSLVLDLDLNRTLPLTSEQFALRLLELNRVHVHGGHLFGFEEGCQAVISLLCPEREFQTGLGLLIQCAESSAHG